jgi:type I restriction enzyme, S subunit
MWNIVKLENICDVDWGNTSLTKKFYNEDGDYLGISAAGCDGRMAHYEHEAGVPVLSAIGANCGRMFYPEERFTAIKNTITLTPKVSHTVGKFLFYLLTYVDLPQRGAGQPFISKGDIKSFEVTIPPIPEQQRIVAILDQAFADIEKARANAEQNLKNARELFDSYLQQVFSQRGERWVKRSLVSLCTEITVGHVGSMKSEYKDSGVPFLRSQNIQPFNVAMDNAKFIDADFHYKLKKSRLRPGDVAIVRTGYPGTASVIPPELSEANCSDLVIARPGEKINPHYLVAFFNSSFGKRLVHGSLVGAAQKHFNVSSAKKLMLNTPPLEQQNVYVKSIELFKIETENLEARYQHKLLALDELKKSLLQKAFTGELTKSKGMAA